MAVAANISTNCEVNIGDFNGKFTFGYHVNKEKRTKSAIKRICFRKIYGFGKHGLQDDNAKKKGEKEIELMQKLTNLNQDHVIKLFEVVPDESSYWLALEYCNCGNLEEYVNHGSSDEINKIMLMNGCAEGVRFLHVNVPVVHNDIRPSKFLIHRDGGQTMVKLASFSSTLLSDTSFMAPEVICGTSSTTESDVFSLGMVFLALSQTSAGEMTVCTGLKHAGKSVGEAMAEFEQPDMYMQCLIGNNSQHEMLIIEQMLKFEPNDRMDICGVCDELAKLITASETDYDKDPNQKTNEQVHFPPTLSDGISEEKANRKMETRLKKLLCHCDKSSGNCTSEIQKKIMDNGVTVYNMPLHFTYCNKSTMIKKCRIGPAADNEHTKTILLLGATGCGKTTTINAIANYIFGVKLEDGYRLQLTDTSSGGGENTNISESQTKWITAYTIAGKYSCLNYSLTLVDMPGFEDTRGIDYDNELISNVSQLFSGDNNGGINSADVICILAKAGDCRLTPNQRYVLNCVMSLFSETVRKTIVVMCTHADGQEPLALDTLKRAGIPFEKHFKFNNSHLYIDRDDAFAKPYWRMASGGYEHFFTYLSNTISEDLIECQNIIAARQHVDENLNKLSTYVEPGESKCRDISKIKKKLDRELEIKKSNKDYMIIEKVPTKVKVKSKENEYETYCNTCNHPCHENCPNTGDNIKECVAFQDGKCIVCPNKCPIFHHVSNDFSYKQTFTEQKICKQEKKAKYFEAIKTIIETERTLKKEQNEFATFQSKVKAIVSEIEHSLGIINKHALLKQHSYINIIEYLEILVKNEQSQFGDETKTNKIMLHMREKEKLLQKITDHKTLCGDV